MTVVEFSDAFKVIYFINIDYEKIASSDHLNYNLHVFSDS